MQQWYEPASYWLCRIAHGGTTMEKWCCRLPWLFVLNESKNAGKMIPPLLSSLFKQESVVFVTVNGDQRWLLLWTKAI